MTKRAALGLKTLIIFSKVHEFAQNIVFRPGSARFVIFALGAPLFNDFQQGARQDSIFIPISAFLLTCDYF